MPMKRTPMRRTGFLKRGKRLASVSKKTRTERWPILKALRAHVLARAHWQCEYGVLGHWGPLDVHHVVSRSQKRDDTPDNAVALCRLHHEMVTAPLSRGRLFVWPLGGERFLFEMVNRNDKWGASFT